MDIAYKDACSEVSFLLKELPENEIKKIPMELLNFINKNSSKYYKVDIDSTNIKKHVFKEETYALLALIYRKYLVSPYEKEELDRRFYNKLQQESFLKK